MTLQQHKPLTLFLPSQYSDHQRKNHCYRCTLCHLTTKYKNGLNNKWSWGWKKKKKSKSIHMRQTDVFSIQGLTDWPQSGRKTSDFCTVLLWILQKLIWKLVISHDFLCHWYHHPSGFEICMMLWWNKSLLSYIQNTLIWWFNYQKWKPKKKKIFVSWIKTIKQKLTLSTES